MPCDAARQNEDSMAASESTCLFPRTTESAQRDTESHRGLGPRGRGLGRRRRACAMEGACRGVPCRLRDGIAEE
jgi:hypothetical protein